MGKLDHIPPKLPQRILEWFLRHDLAEEVLGDLEEKFYLEVQSKSRFRAYLNYWFQVLHYLRPFAIRPKGSRPFTSPALYLHHFKITLRNFQKQKLYSYINVFGLASGFACFILIAHFIQYEYSFDRHSSKHDRIYQVYQQQSGNSFMGSDYFALTPAKLAPVLIEDVPEVEDATTLSRREVLLISKNKSFLEYGLWVDSHFFDVFHHEFIKGSTKWFEKQSIILTATLAEKIFGEENPIGQLVEYQLFGKGSQLIVTGVITDPPANSTLRYQYVMNINIDSQYVRETNQSTWSNNGFYTFLLLREHSHSADLDQKFPHILTVYQDSAGYASYPFQDSYHTAKLTDLHLRSGVNFDIGEKGNPKFIYLFSFTAVIVLILACFNYMNLAIARSMRRVKEVGVRKTIGAMKSQLVKQFLAESIIISTISLILGLILAWLILPYFAFVIDRPLHMDLSNEWMIPGLLFLAIIVGLMSGSYPAFFMSSLNPISVLKGTFVGKHAGLSLQKWLVITQFVASIVLITCSLVIFQQLQYVHRKDPGFSKDLTLVLFNRDIQDEYNLFKNELLESPAILGVTSSSHLPSDISSSTILNYGNDLPEDDVVIYKCITDEDFLEVFDIPLLAGEGLHSFSNGYLINEEASNVMGWDPQEAIGKELEEGKVVAGVIRDFHMYAMYLPIAPLMISQSDYLKCFISIKIRPDNLDNTIERIDEIYKGYSDYPMNFKFMDDHYDQLYQSDQQLANILGFYTLISILIACMGLFGLAAFSTSQRAKEIGIRKILGASIGVILALLAKDFLKLILIAFLISIPLSWFFMSGWLENFAYRVQLEWWVFGIAGFLSILLANLAIIIQSFRASKQNPVDKLRSE